MTDLIEDLSPETEAARLSVMEDIKGLLREALNSVSGGQRIVGDHPESPVEKIIAAYDLWQTRIHLGAEHPSAIDFAKAVGVDLTPEERGTLADPLEQQVRMDAGRPLYTIEITPF